MTFINLFVAVCYYIFINCEFYSERKVNKTDLQIYSVTNRVFAIDFFRHKKTGSEKNRFIGGKNILIIYIRCFFTNVPGKTETKCII